MPRRHDPPHSGPHTRSSSTEWVADPSYLKVSVRQLQLKLGEDADHPRYIQTEWGSATVSCSLAKRQAPPYAPLESPFDPCVPRGTPRDLIYFYSLVVHAAVDPC